jgi:hypothetical protein
LQRRRLTKGTTGKGMDMHDEIYDREYQAGRAELHAGIDRAVLAVGRSLATTFDAIHDIQFAAPWKAPDHKAYKPSGLA